MIEVGRINKLKITKLEDRDVVLDGQELGDLVMLYTELAEENKVGDEIEVFVGFDPETGNLMATTTKPIALVDEFAVLKVVSVSSMGAFMYWGLKRDLLVPEYEMNDPMETGKSYLVYVFHDDEEGNDRIIGSRLLEDFLEHKFVPFEEDEEVDLLIFQQTDLGYKAIVNNTHQGILYKSEVFQPLEIGQRIKGYIRKIRDDNKIDLILHKPGYEKIDSIAKDILTKLKAEDGFIGVFDDSDADEIYGMFGISKKSFKKAIGSLYKQKLIDIEEEGIRLIEQQENTAE